MTSKNIALLFPVWRTASSGEFPLTFVCVTLQSIFPEFFRLPTSLLTDPQKFIRPVKRNNDGEIARGRQDARGCWVNLWKITDSNMYKYKSPSGAEVSLVNDTERKTLWYKILTFKANKKIIDFGKEENHRHLSYSRGWDLEPCHIHTMLLGPFSAIHRSAQSGLRALNIRKCLYEFAKHPPLSPE